MPKWNVVKAGVSVLTRPEVARNTPVHLQLEPTTVCNLKCAFCIREKNVFRPKSMNLEGFKEVFDQIRRETRSRSSESC